MKIKDISVGQVFKNYPALCEALGEKTKTGNAKIAQLKEFERFLLLDKNGYKFTVKEIYKTPKISTSGKGVVFNHLIQLLIADFLVEEDEEVQYLTTKNLFEKISMVNQNYNYCDKNVSQLSKYTDIPEEIIYDFFSTTYSNYSSAIKTALKNLAKRSVLGYMRVTRVCTDSNEHRNATDKEFTRIIEIEKEVIRYMGYSDVGSIINSKNRSRFQSEMNSRLLQELKIKYSYKAYKIYITKYLEDEKNEMLLKYVMDVKQREEYKNELNKILCERLLDNAINRQKVARNPESNKMNEELKKLRMMFSYEKDTVKTIHYVIDRSNQIKIFEQMKNENKQYFNSINSALDHGKISYL